VTDEDERVPLVAEPDEDMSELLDALGREHARGLVKDEHLRITPERLDDLDLLLLSERQLPGASIRVDGHVEELREFRQPTARDTLAQPNAAVRTEHEVLEHV